MAIDTDQPEVSHGGYSAVRRRIHHLQHGLVLADSAPGTIHDARILLATLPIVVSGRAAC
jgi:hypothetical protein